MRPWRNYMALAALGVLAAALQLICIRWGVAGDLLGVLLVGILILAAVRLLAIEETRPYIASVVAGAGSLLGLLLGLAADGAEYPPAAWAAPLMAALPGGILTAVYAWKAPKCQLCQTPLRRLLSFSCHRCRLVTCENCWDFERDRCRLCEANQIPLFPLEYRWWQKQFGFEVQEGRCALCLRMADGRIAHWGCGDCGHAQCRSCWDDNNGQCSRCGWLLSDMPLEVSEYLEAGRPDHLRR
jgi:hypothetical protein